jgi:hypothetical protein
MTALGFFYNPPLNTPDFQNKQYYFMKIIEAGLKIFQNLTHQVRLFFNNIRTLQSILKTT